MAIISAGTSDEHVAEECRATADVMGCYCFRLADVSVDGLHRILHNLPGQLHISCVSQAAKAPAYERQQAPCGGLLKSRDSCTCAFADSFQFRTCPQQSRSRPGWRPGCCLRGWCRAAAVRAADVIVVVAGTDGALPAVVAGLVEAPVIAVPTSVGYGAALQVHCQPQSHQP